MRRVFHCLVVVSLCALLSGLAAAQEKQKKQIPKFSAMPGGPSNCDAVAGNLVSNCGFETGLFAPEWTQSGDLTFTGVGMGPPVAHSGNWGVFSGPVGTLGFITQQVPTSSNAVYDLSFWLRNAQTPNEFQVSWNGTPIYDQINMPDFPYTSSDMLSVGNPSVFIGLVPSDGDTTELKFGFFNIPDFFWFDDVVLVAE